MANISSNLVLTKMHDLASEKVKLNVSVFVCSFCSRVFLSISRNWYRNLSLCKHNSVRKCISNPFLLCLNCPILFGVGGDRIVELSRMQHDQRMSPLHRQSSTDRYTQTVDIALNTFVFDPDEK
jgi:hypothetical protein